MPSSTRPRIGFFSFLLLLASAAAMGSACSMGFDMSLSASEKGGGASGATDAAESGTTGAGGNGPIIVPPQKGPDGQTSYTDLCGNGCLSGPGSIGCSVAMNPDGSPQVSCQIVPTASGASAACLPPGDSVLGEPCTSVSDCQPGLGCVRLPSGGVCRPYCCGDLEACEAGSYCTPVAMMEDAASPTPIEVPVCIPAVSCTLLDDTTCDGGLTCTLVRADGTTSCVEPGEGLIGDDCPCSAGHVCSKALHKCLALCHVGSTDCPEGMLCQGGAKSFPDGIGVCVM